MPIKKKAPAKKAAPLGPKAKLMKLQVTTLRNKAKKLGISEVSKRTKENLAQSILLAEARKKRGTAAGKKSTAKRSKVVKRTLATKPDYYQTGSSDFTSDYARLAFPPGRRVTDTGSVYYERRKNRSDAPNSFTGYKSKAGKKQLGEKYNGWTNYETWLINVYYDDFIADYIQDAVEQGETSVYRIGESLKDYFEEIIYESMPDNNFIQDLVNAGLSEISWRELVLNAGSNFDLKD